MALKAAGVAAHTLEGVGAGAHHVVPKVARIEGAPIEKHTSAALAAIVDEGTTNPGA